jgi:apolipoprotein D and lipocalin family protein
MNKKVLLIAGCLATLSGIAIARAAEEKRPLRVVPEVDLPRYAGQWYEIARLPNRFQKRCGGEVTAQYTVQANGKISVLNRCRLESGEQIQAEGVARVVGKGQPNSILKVRFAPVLLSFIPQVWGDYQIMALSPDYTYALVGDPARKYLWILSRSPQMDEATYNRLVAEARSQDFDVGRLQKTRQSGS